MKKILALLSMFFLISCGSLELNTRQKDVERWMQEDGKIKVLSTIAMIHDLVQAIGGDYVNAMTLITLELDPHSYQLVKGDDELLQYADLIFYNGLGLEHGPSLQSYLLNSPKAIPLGNRVMDENKDLVLRFKGQIDPHIWLDITLWTKTIPHIVEKLSEKVPEHADDFKARGEALTKLLIKSCHEVREQLQSIPPEKRYLVTSHDAFNYFTRAYLATDEEIKKDTWHDRFAAPEGLAPDSQISLTDIQDIIDHLTKYNIRVLFPESNVSQDSLRKILSAANEKGIKVRLAKDPLYGDSMGRPGSDGDTYPKMVKHNAAIITRYLMESHE